MEINGIASRRGLLQGAAVGGIALALPFRAAWAQQAEEAKPDDVAAFLESLELAAVEVYAAASATRKLTTPALVQASNAYGGHHREHAARIAGFAGPKATGRANANLARVLRDQLQNAADEKAVGRILYDLESGLAGAYIEALGTLADPRAAEAVAAALPVESQHAVVFGTAIGLDLEDTVLPSYETQERGLSTEQFPLNEEKE